MKAVNFYAVYFWQLYEFQHISVHDEPIVWHPIANLFFLCWGVIKHSFIHLCIMNLYFAYSARKSAKTSVKPNDVRPKIDLSRPIAHQCRQSTVAACGPQLLKGLFSKSRDVRKSSLLLIHDLVLHDSVHFKCFSIFICNCFWLMC